MPIPLSRTVNSQPPGCRRAPTWISGFRSPLNVMALPIRFWKTWVSSTGLDVIVGKGSCVITAPDSSMLTRQAPQHPVQDGADVRALGHLASARAGVGQQVVDQPLHPRGPVGGEGDVLVGLGVQLSLAAVLQQAHEPGHHPQRLLQVVRGHVGELLQVLVGAGQVLGRLPQGLLGPLAVGDVVDDAYEAHDARWPSRRQLAGRDGHGHVEASPVAWSRTVSTLCRTAPLSARSRRRIGLG